MQKVIFSLLFLFAVALIGAYFFFHKGGEGVTLLNDSVLPVIFFDGAPLHVEVVDSEPKRERGLSYRTALPITQAMLFVFDTSDTYGIWMKDMKFPIDIFWLDENGRVVDFLDDASPDSYPRVFRPKEAARYVLETNADYSELFDVGQGSSLELAGIGK